MRPDVAATMKKGPTAPIYIMYGEDAYSRGRNVDELVERLTSMRGGADVNAFDAAESSVDDIASAVMTAPMFASARVVIVRRFEEMSADDQARLIRTLAVGKRPADLRVPDETHVVIAFVQDRTRKEANAAGPGNASHARSPARPPRRSSMPCAGARARQGVGVRPDAASLLLEMAGWTTHRYLRIQKLITYLVA